MILVDTSVWVSHLKTPGGDAALVGALRDGTACTHAWCEGELLLAGAPVDLLFAGVQVLPAAPHDEVMAWVRRMAKPVRGVGWVDVHLVYTARASRLTLLTHDRAQRELFQRAG